MNWYCRFEDRRLGPLTAAQLKDLAERGEIDDRWQVRRETDEQWRPATQVRGLPIRSAGTNVDYLGLLDSWAAELASGVVPPEATAGIPQAPPQAVMPPPAAASPTKGPPPLPRRAGPPPLPVRSTSPTETEAPIPSIRTAASTPPASVAGRPLSITILACAALAIGFTALFSPALAIIPAVESLAAERGIPNGLLVACGVVGGLAALVGGLGLLAGAVWSRRLLDALVVVELIASAVVLPIGWFVAAFAAAAVAIVLLYREPARAYLARPSTAPAADEPGWMPIGRWSLAGLNGALVIAGTVLRITHVPAPAEPTLAVRDFRAEASSTAISTASPSASPTATASGSSAPVGLRPLPQAEQTKVTPFEDDAPQGGVLVGFDVGMRRGSDGRLSVSSLRPIYRREGVELKGERHGAVQDEDVVAVRVPDEHAVVGIHTHGDDKLRGLALVHLTMNDSLAARTTSTTEWVGERPSTRMPLTAWSRFANGIRAMETVDGIQGLTLTYSTTVRPGRLLATAASRPAPSAKLPRSKRFEASAPDGGLLVGFEVGLTKSAAGMSKVTSLRPIFRVGETESMGGRYGAKRDDEVVVVKAPAGHAVAGLRTTRDNSVDGLSLTWAPIATGTMPFSAPQTSQWLGTRISSARVLGGNGGSFIRAIRAVETDEGVSYLEVVSISRPAGPRPPLGRAPGGVTAGPNGQRIGPGSAYGPRAMPAPTGPPRYPKFAAATPFREPVPPGAWLVGFEATLSSADADALVTSVRPIFRKDGVEAKGERRGSAGPRLVEAKVPEGYAVSGLMAPGGVTRDGFSVLAMKIVDKHLDPRLQQVVPIGGAWTALPDSIGVGVPVRAVFGRTNEQGEFIGMGLEFAKAEIAEPDPWKDAPELVAYKPDADMTGKAGGGGSGISAGTTEGPVTAVEFGLVEWFGRDVIGAIHAIGEKNQFGGPNKQWNWDRKIRIDARSGYALSAMRVYGETNADGARLTFSRVWNGRLELADSYESEPVGDVDEERVVLLSSRGRVVRGLYTAQMKGRVTGLMLKLAPISDGEPPQAENLPPAKKQAPEEVEAAHGAKAETAMEGLANTRVVGAATGKITQSFGFQWGGSLMGFEVGLTKRDGKEVVCGLRPIHISSFGGSRDRSSRWTGSPGSRQVRVEAKPGYAVSAVRVYEQDGVDGLRLTFSRIDGEGLDIQVGYNAETAGTADEARAVQLTGRGRRIIGASITTGDNRIAGFGLLFAKPKEPAK